MKKIFIICYILLNFFNIVLAQELEVIDKNNNNWQIGFFLQPSTTDKLGDFTSDESFIPLGFGTSIGMKITDKVLIETGLNFRIHNTFFRWTDIFNQDIKESNTNVKMIEIPLKLRYFLLNESIFSLYISSGLNISKSFGWTDYSVNGEFIDEKNFSSFRLFLLNIGIGCQYFMKSNWSILFEPSFGYIPFGNDSKTGIIELRSGIVYHF